MGRLGMFGLGVCLALSARAESVSFPYLVTLQAKPSSCQAVSFGPDVGGFDFYPNPDPTARYTFVMLAVDVTEVVVQPLGGALMEKFPPALQIPKGRGVFLLEGQATDLCPRLKKPSLKLMLRQRLDCDVLPYRGMCVPPMRFVDVVDPSAR